jgi:hypothetical protein
LPLVLKDVFFLGGPDLDGLVFQIEIEASLPQAQGGGALLDVGEYDPRIQIEPDPISVAELDLDPAFLGIELVARLDGHVGFGLFEILEKHTAFHLGDPGRGLDGAGLERHLGREKSGNQG